MRMAHEKPTQSQSRPNSAHQQARPSDKELPELDNPNVGNPDSQAGPDTHKQRPITDNKAGG